MDDATQILFKQILDGQNTLTKTVTDGFKEHGERLANLETKLETQVAPMVDDAKYQSRVRYAVTFVLGAVGAWFGVHFPQWWHK